MYKWHVFSLFVCSILLACMPTKPATVSGNGNAALSLELQQILGSIESPKSRAKSISLLNENGGRVSWSPSDDIILMDRKGDDGYYDIYMVLPDGSNEQCITCDLSGVLGKGHIGQPEWHPSGKYIVFQVQKSKNQGRPGRHTWFWQAFGSLVDGILFKTLYFIKTNYRDRS
ncbi:MAG: hypothetical protein R3182_09360 [Draconibacterium sp.]|nr:hypothetical protein [Draconibacterium sp.]